MDTIVKISKALIGFVLLLGLAACGGGGGGDSSDSGSPTGVFVDSPVSGLRAVSPDRVDFTDANGRFEYLNGAFVFFAIGDIVIGGATGQPTMTPFSFVPTATDETQEEVTNVARFLQTLDFDQDVSNGIEIAESVRTAAAGITMDFSQSIASFEASEQATVDLLTSALPNGPRTLVPTATAQQHLGRNLRALVAGRYDGTYVGDDSGPFSVYIGRDGQLFGWAISPVDGLIELNGSGDIRGGFLAGNASTGAAFQGTIQPGGALAGTWQLLPDAGTFSGSRTVAVSTTLDTDLIAMFAGTWSGVSNSNTDGVEPLTVVLDNEGNISLVPADDIASAITSTSGNSASFSALQPDGTEIQGTITLPGQMEGTFNNSLTRESGTFTAALQ